MKLFRLLAAVLIATSAVHADDDAPGFDFSKTTSPDGRFAARGVGENGVINSIRIEDVPSGRMVVDLGDQVMTSDLGAFGLVWSKDSKCFAANFRSGGRYDTTLFFRLEKNEFAAMDSPEGALYEKIVVPARKRDLKEAGKPADTHLRRIWDSWETVKWTSANTAEIHGESTAAYYEGDDPVDIAVAVDATVEFGADGKLKILKAVEVPAKD